MTSKRFQNEGQAAPGVQGKREKYSHHFSWKNIHITDWAVKLLSEEKEEENENEDEDDQQTEGKMKLVEGLMVSVSSTYLQLFLLEEIRKKALERMNDSYDEEPVSSFFLPQKKFTEPEPLVQPPQPERTRKPPNRNASAKWDLAPQQGAFFGQLTNPVFPGMPAVPVGWSTINFKTHRLF